MLNLRDTDSIRIVATTAALLDVVSAYAEADQEDLFSPRPQREKLNAPGTATVIDAPAAELIRLVPCMSVFNVDTDLPNHVTVEQYSSATLEATTLWSGLLMPGQSVGYTGDRWQRKNQAGCEILYTGGPVDFKSYLVAGAYVWEKPTAFNGKITIVIAYGAGGGGAGGPSQTGTGSRTGGGGGGGGCRIRAVYATSSLAIRERIIIAGGGAGGAGGLSGIDGGAGGSGNSQGVTSFASGMNNLLAFGGGTGSAGQTTGGAARGGGGGGTGGGGQGVAPADGGLPGIQTGGSAGGGGSPGAGAITSTYAEYGGGGGAGCENDPAIRFAGGGSLLGGCGGGCGAAAKLSAPTLINAEDGGSHGQALGGGGLAGTSGAAPTDGAPGVDGNMSRGGTGGGGGGGTITANTSGKAGAAGGSHGGGGGGGGIGCNTGSGGNGGRGGDGAMYVITIG